MAVKLYQKLNAEVISLDSRQIYGGMPIGTSQPTEQEMEGIPHHLIGFSDPRESMSFIISQGLFCILQESLMEVYTKGSQYILNQMGDNVVDLLPNLLNKAKVPPNGSEYH